MKAKNLFFILLTALLPNLFVSAQNADEIVKKADDKMRGEKSSYSEMTMKIIRPDWERTLSFKSWTKGTDLSMALITAPAKEKGQTFLKRGNEMWNWIPDINRMIKLPPSMLSQGWMGSDYTNDDLLNQSSIVNDYTHKIIGNEEINGRACYKIELLPKENAPVVWGKVLMWISKDEYLTMKSEYYDEDGYLTKTETASEVKTMDGRLIPTKIELIPADKKGNKTLVIIDNITFNKPIQDGFFSQQNMKRLH